VSEGTELWGLRCRCSDDLLRTTLARYEDSDTFDHLRGGRSAFGEEDIGVNGSIESIDGAGDDHRRQARMELFGAADEFVAVHLRHDEVAEDEIERAGEILIEKGQRLLRAVSSDDAIATSFEEEGADGENLFVVIYAEDGLLGAHAVSLLPDTTLWWLAADGPV